jgi:hypothetical protein
VLSAVEMADEGAEAAKQDHVVGMVLAVLQIAELPVSVILQGDGVTHLHAGLDNLEQVVRLNVMDERSDGFRTCIADVTEVAVPNPVGVRDAEYVSAV